MPCVPHQTHQNQAAQEFYKETAIFFNFICLLKLSACHTLIGLLESLGIFSMIVGSRGQWSYKLVPSRWFLPQRTQAYRTSVHVYLQEGSKDVQQMRLDIASNACSEEVEC